MKKTMKPSVTVVIVTWNEYNNIPICLDSLSQQTYPIETIVVVDNNSSDGTPDLIAEKYPDVRLIRREINGGFPSGNNIGINATVSDWVLTLNADTRPENNYIELLIKFASERPRLGSLTGKLYREKRSEKGELVIDSTGIEIFRSRRVKDRTTGLVDNGLWNNEERVFGVCAAAALYKREMLNDISPDGEAMPSCFFMNLEDADLAWRAWRRDWEAWYVPQAVCWHQRGGSPLGSPILRRCNHRNRLWLIARNEPLGRILKNLPSLIIHESLMFLRMLRYPYLFKSLFQALAGLPAAIRYRKSLPDTTDKPPPFVSGSGFSLTDVGNAIKG